MHKYMEQGKKGMGTGDVVAVLFKKYGLEGREEETKAAIAKIDINRSLERLVYGHKVVQVIGT